MKHTLLFLILSIAVIFNACDKTQMESDGNNSLIGKWKLIETLADPGDGSGKWTPVAANYNSTIKINADNTIETTGQEFSSVKSYRVVDSEKVEITFTNNTSTINYRYKVANSILEINPPCIEACGLRYVRIKE